MADLSSCPLWLARPPAKVFPALAGDIDSDVVVIGGGVAGMTAALTLQSAGKQVVVLEMRGLGSGETGHTTAHLSEQIDISYRAAIHKFGCDRARDVAASQRAAIDQIEEWVHGLSIACDFTRLPGFLYSEDDGGSRELECELQAMQEAGLEAAWTEVVPLPFDVTGALKLERQGQIHPGRYLEGLAQAFTQRGGRIFEQTRVLRVEEGNPCRVEAERGTVSGGEVLCTTHVPSINRLMVHPQLAAYRSYAIARRLKAESPPALYWDTMDPYHYLRFHSDERGQWLILGGEDHKTGKESDPASLYERLEEYAGARFSLEESGPETAFRWSGQILEPADGLPFIGRNPGSRHLSIATGFSGNGMTFGTLAGGVLADAVLGKANRWASLYSPMRFKPRAQIRRFLSENIDFPIHRVAGLFQSGEVQHPSEIPINEGRLVRSEAGLLAVYRDGEEGLKVRTAVCPHLGCHVRWNNAERSWDCPCHGSRFDPDGRVLNGPALSDLAEERWKSTV